MNDLDLFLKGILIGFSIAAPVGPIGVLCIRRTLADGRLNGLLSGLGAASADGVYGIIAASGITLAVSALDSIQKWVGLAGSIFLLYLGIKTFFSKVATQPAGKSAKNLGSAYLSTFFLTLSNPVTILAFIAIFAGAGLASSSTDAQGAVWMVLGVFSGSAAWWLILSTSVGLLRDRFKPSWLVWVNRVSGIVLIAFSVYTIRSLW